MVRRGDGIIRTSSGKNVRPPVISLPLETASERILLNRVEYSNENNPFMRTSGSVGNPNRPSTIKFGTRSDKTINSTYLTFTLSPVHIKYEKAIIEPISNTSERN